MEQNPEGLIDVRGMDREVHKSHHVGGVCHFLCAKANRHLLINTLEMNMYEMYLPSLFVLFTANDVMAGMAMI